MDYLSYKDAAHGISLMTDSSAKASGTTTVGVQTAQQIQVGGVRHPTILVYL